MRLTRFNELIENDQVISGVWSLTKNHELQYKQDGLDELVRFKASLIATDAKSLVIAVTEKQTDQKVVTSLHKLSGSWSMDSQNRLRFEIEKESGKNDVLTFENGWRINESQEIIYRWEETTLKTKKKIVKTLAFQGHWALAKNNELVYFLGASSDATFKIRGAFQSKSILAKEGEIRYQLGAETTGSSRSRIITLFGKWKLSKTLGLSFEIENVGSKKHSIALGADYRLTKTGQITATIKNASGQKLGFEIIFTKDFIQNQGQWFVRLKKSLEESTIEGGVKIAW